MLPHLKDIPYFVIIIIGIFLPELYLRMRWKANALMIVRLSTLLLCCVLATVIDVWLYPGTDPVTPFTRAFIFIGICRVIMLSSHNHSAHKDTKER